MELRRRILFPRPFLSKREVPGVSLPTLRDHTSFDDGSNLLSVRHNMLVAHDSETISLQFINIPEVSSVLCSLS